MNRMMIVARRAGAAVALASLNVAAFAQATGGGGVDVSAATTEIASSKTAVLAVGLAVFGVALGVKLYKWIKSAL